LEKEVGDAVENALMDGLHSSCLNVRLRPGVVAAPRRPRLPSATSIKPAAVEQPRRDAYSAIDFIRIADAQATLGRCKVTVNNASAEMIPAMLSAALILP
jgi:hypothetical protein